MRGGLGFLLFFAGKFKVKLGWVPGIRHILQTYFEYIRVETVMGDETVFDQVKIGL